MTLKEVHDHLEELRAHRPADGQLLVTIRILEHVLRRLERETQRRLLSKEITGTLQALLEGRPDEDQIKL